MTNRQRAYKIHTEIMKMWPTCDELWSTALTGRVSRSRIERMLRGRSILEINTKIDNDLDATYGITALAQAGNGDLDYRITNAHINNWREEAEKSLQKAIERSAELDQWIKEFDRTHPI